MGRKMENKEVAWMKTEGYKTWETYIYIYMEIVSENGRQYK